MVFWNFCAIKLWAFHNFSNKNLIKLKWKLLSTVLNFSHPILCHLTENFCECGRGKVKHNFMMNNNIAIRCLILLPHFPSRKKTLWRRSRKKSLTISCFISFLGLRSIFFKDFIKGKYFSHTDANLCKRIRRLLRLNTCTSFFFSVSSWVSGVA